jgi:hypothetical protein
MWKSSEGDSVFGNGAPKDSRPPILCADPRAALAIVGDGFEERVIVVHVWMMGVGFIVLFMTPFFIAVHTGDDDADD